MREQPDGSLLATIAGRTRKLFGQEEPLGIRVSIDGTTVFIPNVSDPTELRTDVTGKVVRYLQPDGAAVKKGTPYVEVEASPLQAANYEDYLTSKFLHDTTHVAAAVGQ